MFINKSKKKLLKESEYKTVVNNLDSVCKCLDSIYSINNGGCCYIAYIIADILSKEGIEYEVIVLPADKDEEMPDDFTDIDCSAFHVYIGVSLEDGFYTINNMADEDIDNLPEYHYLEVSTQEILNYYKRGNWNWLYDTVRNKFIKYIINLLYDNFSSSLRKGRRNNSGE